MILNSKNIEELVLNNPGLLNKLHHLKTYIDQWKLGQMVPALRSTGQKAKLDLLNTLSIDDIKIIRNYLNVDAITVEKLEYSTIKNYVINIRDSEKFLNKSNMLFGDFCISRDGDQLYLCSWR